MYKQEDLLSNLSLSGGSECLKQSQVSQPLLLDSLITVQALLRGPSQKGQYEAADVARDLSP